MQLSPYHAIQQHRPEAINSIASALEFIYFMMKIKKKWFNEKVPMLL